MKIKFTEGTFTIKQYGQSEKCELKMDDAVGMSLQADGTWAMVGDFYHSRNEGLHGYYGNNQKFSADLTTAYAVEEAKSALEAQNFFCTDNADGIVGSDGLIHMVYESWS
jgi:hypothetical protein